MQKKTIDGKISTETQSWRKKQNEKMPICCLKVKTLFDDQIEIVTIFQTELTKLPQTSLLAICQQSMRSTVST